MIAGASPETYKVAAGLALAVIVWWHFEPSRRVKADPAPMASVDTMRAARQTSQDPDGDPPAVTSAQPLGGPAAASASAQGDADSQRMPFTMSADFIAGLQAQDGDTSSPAAPPPTPKASQPGFHGPCDADRTCAQPPEAKRSCMRRAESMPNLQQPVGLTRSASANALLSLFGVKGGGAAHSQRPKLRFNERATLVKIDSHHDLSEAERSSVYYGKADMRGFVGYELKRRAAKGIASMSALAPEAEAAGELDDAIPAAGGPRHQAVDSSTETARAHEGANDGAGSSGARGPGAAADSGGGDSALPPQAMAPPPAPLPAAAAPTAAAFASDQARSRRESSQDDYEDDDSNIEF